MRASALLPLLLAAIAAAAALIPQAAAADFPPGVAAPTFSFSHQGATLDASGDRLAAWADGTFKAEPEVDPALDAPTFNPRNNASDFHIEDAPSLLKVVNTAATDAAAPAINFAAPFTIFVVLSVPASSACMQAGSVLNPARPCAIVNAGDLSTIGDFAFVLTAGKLSAFLNASVTGALVAAASSTALTADTVTVVRVHFDGNNALELKYDGAPYPAASGAIPNATSSTTWIGAPQPNPSAAAPMVFRPFEGEIMEIAFWPTSLDQFDDPAIFDYLTGKWQWAQTPLAHTAAYPGPLHAPDWILNANASGVTLSAEGLVTAWADTAGAYRTEVAQVAPTVTFNAEADTAGGPLFDARLPAVLFGPGGLTVTPTASVQWNRASLFFVLRVSSTSACLLASTETLNAGCLIWSSSNTGFTEVGDIALTINRDQRLSAGVMLGAQQPVTVTLSVPIPPDVAIVVHLLIDETAGVLLLTDGTNEARGEISVPITAPTAAQMMLLGLGAPAGTSTLSPFDGGMLMELQAWIPSVESSASAVLTRQERLDTIEVLKAKWAPTDLVPALPPAALEQSSTGEDTPVSADSSSSGESSSGESSSGDSSSGEFEPLSPSSSGSAAPPSTTIPASARAVLRFRNGVDCSREGDRTKIKSELCTALGITQAYLAINASTAPPDNRIAIDLFSTGSSGAPGVMTQSTLRALLRRLLAIGGDPTDPALQIAQLEAWRTSDDAPWKRDAASYPALSQLDTTEPIAAVSTSEGPITSRKGGSSQSGDDGTTAVITTVVLVTFFFLLVVSCMAGRYIWKKNAENAHARSTGPARSGGAFGPEDPDRELGERESNATSISGSRGLRRAAADGALRSPSYMHHQSAAHENSLREPSGVGGDGRMREVSLREARKTSGAGGSPLARGRDNGDDDDGADAEEAAVWASLSPESQAAQGRDPVLRLQSIELQPKEGTRRPKASATGGSAAERAAAARAAARSRAPAASHVIASDLPLGADEEEDEDVFAAQGAAHVHNSNGNAKTKAAAFPVRLHE